MSDSHPVFQEANVGFRQVPLGLLTLPCLEAHSGTEILHVLQTDHKQVLSEVMLTRPHVPYEDPTIYLMGSWGREW